MGACFASVSNFKDCADAGQSILVALAVLGGGIWTLFTYTALGTRVRAQRELFEQAVVNVAIKAEQIWLPHDPNFYIAAVATLSNTGNRNVYLDFRQKLAEGVPNPFKISRVLFDWSGWGGLGEPPFESWVRDISSTYNGTLRLRSSSSQELPLFSQVPGPGLYLIEFASALSTKEAIADDNIDPGDNVGSDMESDYDSAGKKPINWVGSAYLIVKPEVKMPSIELDT